MEEMKTASAYDLGNIRKVRKYNQIKVTRDGARSLYDLSYTKPRANDKKNK